MEEIKTSKSFVNDQVVDEQKYSDEILKILKTKDIYIIEYLLKEFYNNLNRLSLEKSGVRNREVDHNIQSASFSIPLNEESLISLSKYIRTYSEYVHIIDTDFNVFIDRFLRRIEPQSIRPLIECISYYKSDSMQHYRKLFSYSKIFKIFRESIDEIFDNNASYGVASYPITKDYLANDKYFGTLIRLLDNNSLVHKNLKGIVSKLVKYAKNDIVEKDIVGCSTIISAICENCPEIFSSTLILSLISYFTKILYTPANYLFLNLEESEIIMKTLIVMIKSITDESKQIKLSSLGLFRECLSKIEEFRTSTVYEEILVVVHMTGILGDLFVFSRKLGNHEYEYVRIERLECTVLNHVGGADEHNTTESVDSTGEYSNTNDMEDTTNKHSGFYIQKISLENRNYETLKDRFIISKYYFIDSFTQYFPCFNRVMFYNDLSKLSFPSKLFDKLKHIKPHIDWTDMIVFACNDQGGKLKCSTNIETNKQSPSHSNCNSNYTLEYLKLIFDQIYLVHPGHAVYLKIYLKNLNFDQIVYFSKYACKSKLNSVIFDVYFSQIGSDNMRCIKSREIILKYLNGITHQNYETNAQSSENLLDLFEIYVHGLDFEQIYRLNSQAAYKNLLLLLIVLTNGILRNSKQMDTEGNTVQKKILTLSSPVELKDTSSKAGRSNALIFLANSCIHSGNSYNGYFIALLSLLYNHPTIDTDSYHALVVSFLTHKISRSNMDELYIKAFPKVFKLSKEEVDELRILIEGEEFTRSQYFKKLEKILQLMEK